VRPSSRAPLTFVRRSGVTISGLISGEAVAVLLQPPFSYSAHGSASATPSNSRRHPPASRSRAILPPPCSCERPVSGSDVAAGRAFFGRVLGDLFDVPRPPSTLKHHQRQLGRAVEAAPTRSTTPRAMVRRVLDPTACETVVSLDVHPKDVAGRARGPSLLVGRQQLHGPAWPCRVRPISTWALDDDRIADPRRRRPARSSTSCQPRLTRKRPSIRAGRTAACPWYSNRYPHLRRGDSNAKEGGRAPEPRRGIMARPMPIPKERHVCPHLMPMAPLIDWETGILRSVRQRGRARRVRDRPGRAWIYRSSTRSRAKIEGGSLRALCGGPQAPPPSRSPNASSGRSSPRARGFPARLRAEMESPFRETNTQLAKLAKEIQTGPALLEHRRQACSARPRRHIPD